MYSLEKLRNYYDQLISKDSETRSIEKVLQDRFREKLKFKKKFLVFKRIELYGLNKR